MLEKYFVPYDRALKLKELGFDGECVTFYENNILKAVDQHWGMSFSGISEKLGYKVDDLILAPLFCQVFDWFREKYNLNSFIVDSKSYNWYFNISDMLKDDVVSEVLYFKTFEEAQLACLDKLIEICSSVS